MINNYPDTNKASKHMGCLKMSVLISFFFLLVPGSTKVLSQDKALEIDKIFNWATPGSPGCACAISQNGKLVFNRAYGSADLERDVPLTTNSVFDIASIQKQFVAASILLLVEEGKLSLSDDIRKHIPQLPDYGHKITIDHLLTHTSGLRDWTGILPLADGNPDAMTVILRQRGLNFAPGEEWSYSNSGYVLLKEIIARTSGLTVDEFMRKRLFEPLGMKSSQYLSDLREVVKNRALAFEKQGNRWKLDLKLDNDRGGGGAMLSTANDLITWNNALANSRLGKFVSSKIQEPAKLKNGRKIGYARALFLDNNRGGRVIWHTGGSAGYGSVLANFPEQDLSVAIVCNSGDEGNRMAAVRRIFDLFVPASATTSNAGQSPDTKAGVMIDQKELENKSGLFFSETTNQPLRLAVSNGKLRVAGGSPLVTIDKNHFRNSNGSLSFMSDDMFELRFISNDQVELKSMEGKISSYRRARPFKPTAQELKGFAGRFHSKEIGGYFDLTVLNSSLMGRVNDGAGPGFPLTPVDSNTFQLANVFIRFVRDKSGKVVALDYSNPLIRNVRYTAMQVQTQKSIPATNK